MSDQLDRPQVTQAEFDKLECNRCGECCEGFFLGNDDPEPDKEGRVGFWRRSGPLGWLELYAYYAAHNESGTFAPQDDMLFFGQLTPRFDEDLSRWRYACGHFDRDETGQGVCTIYDSRPLMCSDFPYGRGVEGFPSCVWAVDIIEEPST